MVDIGVRYWRVAFSAEGTIERIDEIRGEWPGDWCVVQADTEEAARRKGYNLYCARKKKARVAQLHAEGRCVCGRQAIPGTVGCEVCKERRLTASARRRERGSEPAPPRDEAARIATFQVRHRDRKLEVRLEVLLEVRRWLLEAPHVKAFGERVQREISACQPEPERVAS